VEGFGINTNILETNVINLSVVVVILFNLGKDVLQSLLTERKRKIVAALENVEVRFQEAQAKLAVAREKLTIARTKALEIQAQGREGVLATVTKTEARKVLELKRLEETKEATLALERERLISMSRNYLVYSTIARVMKALENERNLEAQHFYICHTCCTVFEASTEYTLDMVTRKEEPRSPQNDFLKIVREERYKRLDLEEQPKA